MRRLFAILTAAALLGGCGSDDDTATPTENSSATTVAESDSGSESGDLDERLLTVGDLPSGFTKAEDAGADEQDSADESDFCKELDKFEDDDRAAAEAEVDFEKSDDSETGGAAFVNEALARYDSEDEADEIFDELADAFEKCKTFEQSDDDARISGTFTKRSFRTHGDETFAARLTATVRSADESDDTEIDMGGDVVIFRDGDMIAMLMAIGFGEPTLSDAEFAEVVGKAAAKL